MISNIKKICLILMVSVLCFSTASFAADFKIEDYRIVANVKENGSIDLVEYLKYHFDESMNGVYREILYKYTFSGQKNDMEATSLRYQASGISNIKVSTSDVSFDSMTVASDMSDSVTSNGMSNVYSITDLLENGYRRNIKVFSPVESEEDKYIKYEYTIKDVIVNYNDYAEFYWNFVGADWECYIDNLDITVNFPESSKLKVYGHTYANVDGINTLGNQFNMKVSGISEGTAVDVRGVFPNSTMKYVAKSVKENYDFSKLDAIEVKAAKDKESYNLSNKVWILLIVLNIITFIYVINKSNKCGNKNIKKYKKDEYCSELLDKYSIGEYSSIMNRMFGYSDPNLIVASILDLSNRKYIKLESLKKVKIFKDTYEYFVSVDTSKDFGMLNDYEKELLNYIFNKKSDAKINIEEFVDNRFELNERFKVLGLDYKLGAKYRKSCSDKTLENDKKMYNPVPKKLWKTYFYGMIMLLAVAVINIFAISPLIDKTVMFVTVVIAEIFVFVVLGSLVTTIAKSLKDEYVDEFNKLIGLKKYLTEYSVIKERYPIEMVLWGKYLVFASLFGIADKVSKEFKDELLKQGYDENYIFTTYPMIHMGIYSHSFATSAASMSGSSSSGGYSGGGGGGGGRRWRWWRCLLICKILLKFVRRTSNSKSTIRGSSFMVRI
jgi:uncharacterized membrane protein